MWGMMHIGLIALLIVKICHKSVHKWSIAYKKSEREERPVLTNWQFTSQIPAAQ